MKLLRYKLVTMLKKKKRYDHLLYVCKYAALKGGQQHLCCILKHFHVLVGLKTVLHLYAAIEHVG